MVPLFGQNPAETCLIFALDFIYQRHHYGLESRNLYFLQPTYLQICGFAKWLDYRRAMERPITYLCAMLYESCLLNQP